MKRFSLFLIWLLGFPRYCRISPRLRRRLGMICGEDLSNINRLLDQIRIKCFEFQYGGKDGFPAH